MTDGPEGSGAVLGRGVPVAGEVAFAGTIVQAESVPEVLALLEQDLSGSVLLTDQAAATALGPILPQLGGVICTAGGRSAHLAIVARGLGLPCLMQTRLERAPEPGDRVAVDADGTVRAG